MRRRRTAGLAIAVGLLTAVVVGGPVGAHNAAHIHLPTGTCLNVGSGKHNFNPQVDRDPTTSGDEYGARWAADQSGTPIYARFCEDPRNVGDHPGH
jgi:hypothetical protein